MENTYDDEIKLKIIYGLTLTPGEHHNIGIACGVIEEFEHLFDGVNTEYMNVFGDTLNILLDIINSEGNFKVKIAE